MKSLRISAAGVVAIPLEVRNPPRKRWALTILLCLVAVCTRAAADDCRPLWTATWFAARFEGFGPDDRFALRKISQYGLHLTGQCKYFQLEGQSPRVAVIQGTDGKDCGFWPDVTSQVKNERTGDWETIAEPFNRSHRKTVTINPGEFNQELLVSLDVFFPFVGKAKLGRLVLTSGEAAVFELEKLLEEGSPPE